MRVVKRRSKSFVGARSVLSESVAFVAATVFTYSNFTVANAQQQPTVPPPTVSNPSTGENLLSFFSTRSPCFPSVSILKRGSDGRAAGNIEVPVLSNALSDLQPVSVSTDRAKVATNPSASSQPESSASLPCAACATMRGECVTPDIGRRYGILNRALTYWSIMGRISRFFQNAH